MTPSSVATASTSVTIAATTTIAGPAIRSQGQRCRYQGGTLAWIMPAVKATFRSSLPREDEARLLVALHTRVVLRADDDLDLARLLPRCLALVLVPLVVFVVVGSLGRRAQNQRHEPCR